MGDTTAKDFWIEKSMPLPMGSTTVKEKTENGFFSRHYKPEEGDYVSATAKVFPNGKEILTQIGDGSIIKIFNKTPLPKKDNDVICPHFYELKWSNGCPFDCAWCFLQGTLRFLPTGKRPRFKDMEKVKRHVRSFYKVLFLSKATRIENLLELKETTFAIVSFSVNGPTVAERWEKRAPHPFERITAAAELYNAGYITRLRIDPMVPIQKWKEDYARLVDKIFENLTPERITLGSLRGLSTTIRMAKDKSWVQYLSESSNWGKKIDEKTRYEMYSFITTYLEKEYDYTTTGLCKETRGMWKKLGKSYRAIKCNCIE